MPGDQVRFIAKPTPTPLRCRPRIVMLPGMAIAAAMCLSTLSMLPAQARAGVEAGLAQPASPSLTVTISVDSTLAYSAPDWNAGQVGRLMKWQTVKAIGRNTNGEWLQVDYGNSLVWLHRTAVRFPGDLNGDNSPAMALPVAQSASRVSPSRIRMTLIGAPVISSRARQIYRQAIAAGRDTNLFTVVGDCNSEPPVYLGRFAAGGFDLTANGFGALQTTARKFNRSFNRVSLAVHGGHNSASVLDPLFADGQRCKVNESPLECELRDSNASIVFIGLGTGDTFTWRDFEANYRRIIETALAQKTLPVLVTKADDLEATQGGAPSGTINAIIRRLGAEYQLPVMDFGLAARRLPDQGLAEEGREVPGKGLVYAAASRFHLSGYGMDMRMLLTLTTLNAIAR